MNSGKKIRLNRIFSTDNRSVVVAMDHGLPGISPLGHLSDPKYLIGAIKDSGANAILTTPGIADKFAEDMKGLGLILRLDGGATTLSSSFGAMQLISSVEDALYLGADAVAVMGFCGTPDESDSLRVLGEVAKECRKLGIPLMAEMLPLGFSADPNIDQIALAARIGAEMGADIIKTKYMGPPEQYQKVTEECFAPVLILGGSARSSQEEMLKEISSAVNVDVAGVAMGRNIWQEGDVTAKTAKIVKAVHG